MQIQNNTKSPRILPDDTVLPPLSLATVDDDAWAAAKKHVVVKSWLASKDIEEVKTKTEDKKTEDKK